MGKELTIFTCYATLETLEKFDKQRGSKDTDIDRLPPKGFNCRTYVVSNHNDFFLNRVKLTIQAVKEYICYLKCLYNRLSTNEVYMNVDYQSDNTFDETADILYHWAKPLDKEYLYKSPVHTTVDLKEAIEVYGGISKEICGIVSIYE